MQELAAALRTARCARGPLIGGARCDDVQAELVHVALTAMPPGPEKDRLQAIPIGLMIKRDSVDLLIAARQTAITQFASLHSAIPSFCS